MFSAAKPDNFKAKWKRTGARAARRSLAHFPSFLSRSSISFRFCATFSVFLSNMFCVCFSIPPFELRLPESFCCTFSTCARAVLNSRAVMKCDCQIQIKKRMKYPLQTHPVDEDLAVFPADQQCLVKQLPSRRTFAQIRKARRSWWKKIKLKFNSFTTANLKY